MQMRRKERKKLVRSRLAAGSDEFFFLSTSTVLQQRGPLDPLLSHLRRALRIKESEFSSISIRLLLEIT